MSVGTVDTPYGLLPIVAMGLARGSVIIVAHGHPEHDVPAGTDEVRIMGADGSLIAISEVPFEGCAAGECAHIELTLRTSTSTSPTGRVYNMGPVL